MFWRSIRRDFAVCVAGSTVRSDVHDQTLLSYSGSGCVSSRNMIVFPFRSRISAFAYSVNRFGQFSTSFIVSQTKSSGASIVTVLSVFPISLPLFPQPAVRIFDRVAERCDLLRVLVRDREPVVLLDRELDLDECERVEAEILERDARVLRHGVLGKTDAVDEDVLDVGEGEFLNCHLHLLRSEDGIVVGWQGPAEPEAAPGRRRARPPGRGPRGGSRASWTDRTSA